ncbi:MAG: sulfur carrier protein ThiS [Sphaerochaetaceae bacterium]
MIVTFNNEKLEINKTTSVKEFLNKYSPDSEEFAIFINEQLLKPDKFETYLLKESDNIIKIEFLAGG